MNAHISGGLVIWMLRDREYLPLFGFVVEFALLLV